MNIFYLDTNPLEAAAKMVTKHLVKMQLESAQLVCTAVRLLCGTETELVNTVHPDYSIKYHLVPGESLAWTDEAAKKWEIVNQQIYRMTHVNHPSNIWIRESYANFKWLIKHAFGLQHYWKKHYGHPEDRESESIKTINKALTFVYSQNWPSQVPTPIRVAISDSSLHRQNPVCSYRNYYLRDKTEMGWRPEFWSRAEVIATLMDIASPVYFHAWTFNYSSGDKLPRGKMRKALRKSKKLTKPSKYNGERDDCRF